MTSKWCLAGCLLGAALMCFRCGGYKASPVGAQLFQGQNPDMEKRVNLTAASSDTSYRIAVTCEGSSLLFFGNGKNLEAWTYVVFDTITIDSLVKATLSFQVRPYPVLNSGPVILSILPTGSAWDETAMTWENKILPSSETPLFQAEINSADTTSIDLDVPLDVLATFVTKDTLTGRTGILIKTESPGGLFQMYSLEYSASSTGYPHLTLYTASDTLVVSPAKDTFVSNSDLSYRPDILRVQDGIAERSLLHFNIAGIPAEATINRALLILHADPEASVPDPSATFYLAVSPVADSSWTYPNVKTDSTWVASGSFTEDSVAVVVTSLVQKWTSRTFRNGGMMLTGVLEKSDLAGRSFFSSSADSARMPRLDVYYSLPPSGRY
jgi:hypothetical protein